MDRYFLFSSDLIPRFSKMFKAHKEKSNLPEELKTELKEAFQVYKQSWLVIPMNNLVGELFNKQDNKEKRIPVPMTIAQLKQNDPYLLPETPADIVL